MRLTHNVLGRNPLQRTLIDSATLPIFGDPVEAQDTPRLAGQQQRVESLMADGYWHTVPELQKELRRKFGQLYSETSISARIRAMRKRGYEVTHERTRPGSNLYQYRAVNGRLLTDKERHIVEAYLTPTIETPAKLEGVA
jgi:biotin operon repressor